MPPPPPDLRARLLGGAAALACYGIHAAHYLSVGEPQGLLWGCHVAALLVCAGWLTGWARLNGVGLLWLCYGLPLWIVDLAGGGEFLPTSLGTHVGGLLIGLAGARRMGLPAGVWWRGALASAGLMGFTRLVASPAHNVNLAFAVWEGWEDRFGSYPLYAAFIVGLGALVQWSAEVALRRLLTPRPRAQTGGDCPSPTARNTRPDGVSG